MAPGGQDALKQEARTWTVLAVGGHGPRAFSWEHSDCCLLPLQLPLGVPTPFHSSRLPAHSLQPGLAVYSIRITPTCSRLPPTSYLWIPSPTLPGSLQKVPVSTL